MDRRAFIGTIAGGLLAAPLATEAQQPGRVWRIGHLGHGFDPHLIETFRRELGERGYVEGKNIAMEFRYSEGQVERLPDLAAELVRLRVDVIVANGTPAVQAAKRATSKISIVMVGVGLDPVDLGLVASLARPGANVTGVAALGADSDLWAKRLQLIKDASPRTSRAAVLWNPANPGNVLALKAMKTAAPPLGFKLYPVAIRDVSDFEPAFAAVAHDVPDALVMIWDSLLLTHARRIADFAIEKRLPTMCAVRGYVDAGALMSYGTSLPDQWRRAATYVDKILKGAKPADLPVERASRFELVINLKTAKALGLTIPPSLLLRADQLIEQ